MKRILLMEERTRFYLGASPFFAGAEVYNDAVEWSDISLLVTHTEYDPAVAEVIAIARAHGVLCLHIADGVIEWRNSWEHPPRSEEGTGAPLWQPILSAAFACMGDAQIRTLKSWGNTCNIFGIGVPWMDELVGLYASTEYSFSPLIDTVNVLVVTAKTPAFQQTDALQVEQSIRNLYEYFGDRASGRKNRFRVSWRISDSISTVLKLSFEEVKSGKGDLAAQLRAADIVIATPSTVLVEAMLNRKPTICIDYTNSPRYLNTAWTITAPEQINHQVQSALLRKPNRLLFQDSCLRDTINLAPHASARLATLAKRLIEQTYDKAAIASTESACEMDYGSSIAMKDLYYFHGSFNGKQSLSHFQAENAHLRCLLANEREANRLRMGQLLGIARAPFRMKVIELLEKVARRLLSLK